MNFGLTSLQIRSLSFQRKLSKTEKNAGSIGVFVSLTMINELRKAHVLFLLQICAAMSYATDADQVKEPVSASAAVKSGCLSLDMSGEYQILHEETLHNLIETLQRVTTANESSIRRLHLVYHRSSSPECIQWSTPTWKMCLQELEFILPVMALSMLLGILLCSAGFAAFHFCCCYGSSGNMSVQQIGRRKKGPSWVFKWDEFSLRGTLNRLTRDSTTDSALEPPTVFAHHNHQYYPDEDSDPATWTSTFRKPKKKDQVAETNL